MWGHCLTKIIFITIPLDNSSDIPTSSRRTHNEMNAFEVFDHVPKYKYLFTKFLFLLDLLKLLKS